MLNIVIQGRESIVQTHAQEPLTFELKDLKPSEKSAHIHVLHVDDDSSFLEISKLLLTEMGNFEIEDACCVDEAFRKLENKHYDVIVSDYDMPFKDGLQFLKELREQRISEPFILFTGKGREEVAIKALNLGADGYFNKQGDPEVVYGELVHGIKLSVERERARRALDESEKRYRAIIKHAVDGILILSADGKIIDVNKSAVKMLGYSKDELLSMSIGDVDPNGSTDEIKKMWTEALEGKNVTFESKARCKDGKLLPIEVTLGSLLLNGERVIIGAARNITDRKKVEKVLKESQAELEAVISHAPVGIAVSDSKMVFQRANEAFCKVLGYSEDELKKLTYKNITVPGDLNRSIEQMRQLVSGDINSFIDEKRYLRKDGQVIYGRVTVSALRDVDGKPKLFVAEFEDITERKKMDDELHASEEKLRRIINACPNPIAISSLDARIIDCNYSALKEFEYKEKSEVIGKNVLDFFSDKDKTTAMQRLVGRNEVSNEEFIFTTKTGVEFPGELSTRVVDDQFAKPRLFVSIVRNVTEKKKAEKALKEAEQRSRVLFNQAPLGFLLIDPITMVAVEFNDQAYEQLGYTREEFGKLRISDYQAVESLEEIRNRIREIIETGRGSFQTKHRAKDGSIKDVMINVQTINLAGKNLLLCAYLDVTQIKAVEYALMESESKYRLLVEMAQEGVWALDTNNNTVYVNPRIAKMLGYAESEVIGKSFAEFVKREMDYQRDLEKCAQGDARHCELSLVRKDGERIYASIAASPINDDSGNRVGTLALVADITQRKQAEEKLKESYDKLQIMTEKLRVVGGLTRHDVRNKLSGINGYLHLLKKRHENDPETVDQTMKMEQSIKEISRIFDFAKSYEQLGVEELVYLDVKKTISEAEALFSGLPFKVVDNCEGLSLLADSLLRQMFYNFLDNTRKYGQKATQAKMSFKLGPDDSIELVYEDDGVGISAENKLKLFKEGFSSGGSTGFGLFLSKKMVDLYGWTINEVGEPGKGAKFLITIPKMNKKNQPNYCIAKK